ncbi:MAG: hypothetical protein Q4D59_00865 [Erysipelotrichaceae bacterium]|nr:hypothetical protein [Erysipelotrichaceae bacterium]
MNNIEKVYAAIRSNPELLDRIFEEENKTPLTRALPWNNTENSQIREILGSEVSEQDVRDTLDELEGNQIVQLYRQSEGAIDAKELMGYVDDLAGTKANAETPALRALFDGKLQLKEIILIVLLMKLFKKKQQAQPAYTGNNLLNALLGTQTQQQPSITNNLFSSLFGSGQQTQNFGYTNLYPNNNSNSLLNLFGLGSANSSYNNNYGTLNNFLSGNNLSQPGMSQLYNLLNQHSNTGVYSNGQVSVNSLFSILNALLRG